MIEPGVILPASGMKRTTRGLIVELIGGPLEELRTEKDATKHLKTGMRPRP